MVYIFYKVQGYIVTQNRKKNTNEELAKITMRSTTIIAKTSKIIAELQMLHSKTNTTEK